MRANTAPKTHEIWIGTQPEPEDRLKITISAADNARIPQRGTHGTATITDLATGKAYTVRRASCGLPRCLCALELVES